MSMKQGANIAEVRDAIDHPLAEKIDALAREIERPDNFQTFMQAALEEADEMVERNHADYAMMNDTPIEKTPEEVLTPENCDHVAFEAELFRAPRVTVWLKDCPVWANTADYRTFFVEGGLNERNGKVTATIDVRPY